MEFNVSLAQLNPSESPEENIETAKKFAEEAARRDSRLLVFPEFYTTGAPVTATPETIGNLAQSSTSYLDQYSDIARQHGIHIVPGTMVTREHSNSALNTTFLIDDQGNIRGQYSKINLSPLETFLFQRGSETTVVDTDLGEIGLSICYDLFSPEHIRALTAKKAKIVVCPSFWPNGSAAKGLKHDADYSNKSINALTVARSFENGVFILFCNAAGSFTFRDNEIPLLGQSQVTIPFKGTIAKVPGNDSRLLTATLDSTILEDAESVYEISDSIERNSHLYR
jgi:predicted amidohydrolase